jgi:hypothetical protein
MRALHSTSLLRNSSTQHSNEDALPVLLPLKESASQRIQSGLGPKMLGECMFGVAETGSSIRTPYPWRYILRMTGQRLNWNSIASRLMVGDIKGDHSSAVLKLYSAWNAVLPRPSVGGHPLSPQALQWVRSLADRCAALHTSCTSEDLPQLPKRVLFLETTGETDIKVRLVEPDRESADFAALSHSWGSERSCMTTKKTLQDKKDGIPWNSIPQTFRDAITYVLTLGIQYLWIDSLCIVQDDSTDWEIESSRMADIYQSAVITLSATASTGDSQGCFSSKLESPNYLELSLPEDVGACRIAVRRPLKHWHDVSPRDAYEYFPLLSRGWAFQERLLAPRVLHFCGQEIVWQCRELTICECDGLRDSTSPAGEYYNVIEETEKQLATDQVKRDEMLARQLQWDENDGQFAMQIQGAE